MLKLAWRNIWRNSRRTLITVLTIAGGLAGAMFLQSFNLTFQRRYLERAIGAFTGDMRIESADDRDPMLPDQDVENPKEIEAALAATPGVSRYAERVIFTGLVGSTQASIGVTVFGVQPDREGAVNEVLSAIVAGSSSPSPGNSVVIGELLARDLGVGLQDKLVLIGQASNGELGAEPFRIVGLFRTGSALFDGRLVLAPIQPIQDMLYRGDRVTDFIVKVKDIDKVDEAKDSLAARLSGRRDVKVLAWHDINKEVLAMGRWLAWLHHVSLAALIVVVMLGVLNAVLMSILERVREFGVLKSIGAQPSTLFGLVIIECAIIGVLGSALGLALGVAVITVYHFGGLAIPVAESLAYTMPFDEVLYLRYFWADHIATMLLLILACVVAGLVPAVRVLRFRVSEALRYL